MNDFAELRKTLVSLANSANDEQLIEAVLAVVKPYDLGKPREPGINMMSIRRRNDAEQAASRILGVRGR